MTPEARVAEAFRAEVKKRGGWCAKISGMGRRGLPDYIVIMPNQAAFFAELKSDDGRLTELQRQMHARIQAMGTPVFVVRGVAEAKRFFA